MDPNLKSKNLTVFMEILFIFCFFGKFIVYAKLFTKHFCLKLHDQRVLKVGIWSKHLRSQPLHATCQYA